MLDVLKKLLNLKTKSKIILTILTNDFNEFTKQAKQAEEFSDYVQIDVMDGELVDNVSFSERTEINLLNSPLKWELHLMVKHPLAELDKWKSVKNVFRVIFHIEGADDPQAVIAKIKKMGYAVGIAISPDTDIKKLCPYTCTDIDTLLFLTVVPGKQGNSFRPDVGEKIKQLPKKRPTLAVDGSVNENTIQQIKSWGVERFYVGSALTKAPDMKIAYNNLIKKIEY